MTARKCSFRKNVPPLMMGEDRIDFPGDPTDRRESIIVVGTETSNEVILRTRLEMQEVLPSVSRTLAAALD